MENEDLWLAKVRSRLEGYSEPLPAGGWERLEKELCASARPAFAPVPLRSRRRALCRVVAAAAMLAGLLAGGLWLLRLEAPAAGGSSPVVASVSSSLGRGTLGQAVRKAEAELEAAAVRASGPVADAVSLDGRGPAVAGVRPVPVVPVAAPEVPVVVAGDVPTDPVPQTVLGGEAADPRSDAPAMAERQAEQEADVLLQEEEALLARMGASGRKADRNRKWAVGLSVGNSGGFGTSNTSNVVMMSDMQMPGGSIIGGVIDTYSLSEGVVSIPSGQDLVFIDGVPYLRTAGGNILSAHHKQPVTVGFSLRKDLRRGFAVETGLTYTLLASDMLIDGIEGQMSQKLHYVGIPVRASWNIVDTRLFTLYLLGGGAVEKCVHAKVGPYDDLEKPWQFSLTAAVGAQYNIGRHVGVYVEPGVSYYFDDGSSLQTIRKDKPCLFSLQAGFRLSY